MNFALGGAVGYVRKQCVHVCIATKCNLRCKAENMEA